MQMPLQISFHGMEPSPTIEAQIREKAAKLERFHDRIVGCRVVVEAPHRHHHHGKLYNVRIDISVPGKDVFVGHSGPLNHAHEDVYVAIRDAFNAAVRRLEDFVRRHESKVKHHESGPHGVVRMLNRDEGYGFIATPAGDEVYFHMTSVVDDAFKRLKKGAKVRFALGTRPRGSSPQASTVHIVGKHNRVEPL
jgi:ribosomal subunit interface protein